MKVGVGGISGRNDDREGEVEDAEITGRRMVYCDVWRKGCTGGRGGVIWSGSVGDDGRVSGWVEERGWEEEREVLVTCEAGEIGPSFFIT